MNEPKTITDNATASSMRKITIVFVDDEDAILLSLRSLFRREGYSVQTFSSGAEALEFIKKSSVDVVVSDLRMPVMTGIEFLNHVTAFNPQAVRIMLSGYEDKNVVINALSKNLANHYVLKPWNDAEFKTLVSQSVKQLDNLRHRRLENILNTLDSIPSSPKMHEKLRSVLTDSNSSLDAIATEIEANPPILVKVLRIANSIYYASHKTVTSARDAVMFIGTEYIIGLVTAIEAFHSFGNRSNKNVSGFLDKLWTQAIRRATIAKNIAEKWESAVDVNTVYIASLLQDIGFAVRLCAEPEKYLEFIELCSAGTSLYYADKNFFGVTHDDVSAALLEYWNFSPEIVNAVAGHHQQAKGNPAIQILQIAEILEGSDPSPLHDPEINPLALKWKDKIQIDDIINEPTTS